MSQRRPASPVSASAAVSVARGSGGGAAATPERHATDAAIQILGEGGSAVDAAIGAAAVLGVTRPFWCGVGGGGFMLVYTAASRRVTVYDHREAAPRSIEAVLTGRSIPRPELCTGPLFAGVPGVPSGWETAHRAHGRRPMAAVLEPAIHVAAAGFAADAVFIRAMRDNASRLSAFASTRALYFTSGGESPAIGATLKNPNLGRTYETFARSGAQAFYRGAIAEAILKSVAFPPIESGLPGAVEAGVMSADDLAAYETVEREAVASRYRGYVLQGAPPPSSGGATVASILQMLDAFPLSSMPRAHALHYFIEASKLAFADRNAYFADPAFVPVPVAELLSPAYAATRRASIGSVAAASGPVAPGLGRAEGHSTAHLTVCDRDGNIAAYTFTLGSIGGSGMVVPETGFVLNSELTDFTFIPGHANAPQGGKRPRSSMSPTFVFSDGKPVLALGSPGGATIIPAVAHTLIQVLDFGLSLPDAIAAPRVLPGHEVSVPAEAAFLASSEAAELERLGHKLTEATYAGEVAAIAFDGDGGVQAASDAAPRGSGTARVEVPGPER